MAQRVGAMAMTFRTRFQWISYGFIPGIVIGLILGWLFHGVVGTLLRFLLVAILLAPLVIGFIAWQRIKNRGQGDQAVEGRSFVVETTVDERGKR